MKDFKSFKVEMFEAMNRSPYAIGMAQAMKSTGDKPPLEKSTIKKAHKIAKSIMKNESVDDEGNMARGELMRMSKQAADLAMMMTDEKQLDGWVQAKITKAADYLDSAHDYLMFSKQEVDEEHYCAKHVYSDIFGEGVVLEAEHADPDDNGNIEWYTVKFDHGDEVVYTEDLDILMAEYHNNHKKKKEKKEDDTEMNEKLHPNQQKLDVHEPEKDKLTAADFAKLRSMRNKKG